ESSSNRGVLPRAGGVDAWAPRACRKLPRGWRALLWFDRIRGLLADFGDSYRRTVIYMSLSRLNHWLPRAQTHPEVVQGTAEFHHQIADALLPQADAVLHDATPLDTAVDMLDPESPLVEHLVGQVLLQGELRTAGLLRRHEDLHLRERERQKAQ